MINSNAILDVVNELKDLEAVILVEGKRDREALSKLGIKRVMDISGKSVEDVVEDVSKNYDEVLILTDFDEEGRIIEKILKREFEIRHVKVLTSLRVRIKKSLIDVYKIEEIGKVFKFVNENYGIGYSINDKLQNRIKVLRRRKLRFS